MKKKKKVVLNYKHRLFPTNSQKQMLTQQMFVENQVYNSVLNILKNQQKEYIQFFKNQSIKPHKIPTKFTEFRKNPIKELSDTELDAKINSILKNRDLYGETDTRQQARKIAKQAFFDKSKNKPKFHRYSTNQGGFSGVNARTLLGQNWVKLSKRMGAIKIKRERDFPENSVLKTVRIKKENDKYYAIFGIELDKKVLTENDFEDFSKDSMLGMDTNNGHLDFSDGSVVKYERNLNEKELINLIKKGKNKKTKNQKRKSKLLNEFTKIRKLEQKQSKRIENSKKTKEKLGNNYKKDRLKLSKMKEKQKNRRKNLLDKVSNEILSKAFSVLFLEDLSVKDMTSKNNFKKKSNGMSKGQNKSMRKNILNFAYSTLHSKLYYKAMLMDRLVLFVDPAYTTQDCSSCGSRNKMSLNQRIYNCACGFSLARDWNSAINIETKGYKTFFEAINTSSLTSDGLKTSLAA